MFRIQLSRRLMSVAVLCLVAVAASVAQEGEFQAPQPSPEHEQMAREAGVWDAKCKLWFTPDAEAVESDATETNTMLGKFWLLSEFKGNFGGMEFTGRGQFGYDPAAKKCVGTWVDTISPYMQTMEGTYDTKTHTLTMTTEGRDVHTNKVLKGKNVTTYIDNNTKKFEMYGPGPDGIEFKMMEIMYKRRAK
ncbi:MAG: DUF1579 domain-containing protein [Pirellulales bacterium]